MENLQEDACEKEAWEKQAWEKAGVGEGGGGFLRGLMPLGGTFDYSGQRSHKTRPFRPKTMIIERQESGWERWRAPYAFSNPLPRPLHRLLSKGGENYRGGKNFWPTHFVERSEI